MRLRGKLLAVLAAAALAVTGVTTLGSVTAPPAAAASPTAGFDAGNIISDAVFYDSSTMTIAQIQSFLDSKVGSCASGHTCLKNYHETTRSRGADSTCSAFSGRSNESAASIISRVAKACGINPQVILVTLQKEQGLVASSAPSSWAWKASMGYGCPDTTGCDAEYYGFFNQVWHGAWQLKHYKVSSYFNWFSVGAYSYIGYSPNSSCGSKRVKIQNSATAALYYYTPYTPNSAALKAGFGAGDACSSYGNRNFYAYFTQWFGSTQYSYFGAINDEYNAHKRALGKASGVAKWYAGAGGGYVQKFQNGAIYAHEGTGAHAVVGEVRAEYLSQGSRTGALGWPTNSGKSYSDAGGGTVQTFQNGAIYSGPEGAHAVVGDMRTEYVAQHSIHGALGWPTNSGKSYSDAGGGTVQTFQNGAIYSGPEGAHAVVGDMRKEYVAQKSIHGDLGWPRDGSGWYDGAGGGSVQKFQGGAIYSHDGTGTFAVTGDMRGEYLDQGSRLGVLGWPTSDSRWYAGAGGGYVQKFQNGAIYAHEGTGAHAVVGEVRAEYLSQGSRTGALGWPTNSGKSYSDAGGGTVQTFQNGAIYSGPEGAHAVVGDMRKEYVAQKSIHGDLGWPRDGSGWYDGAGGGSVQKFQGGAIYSHDGTGTFAVTGDMRGEYLDQGSRLGVLGWPTNSGKSYSVAGGGSVQTFQNGAIYAGSPGAYAVIGQVRAEYVAQQSIHGVLGWPTGVCSGTTTSCTQPFERGSITLSGGKTTVRH